MASRTSLELRVLPNPAPGRTEVSFRLPAAAQTAVGIYDVTGRLLRTLYTGALDAGSHGFLWDGRDRERHALAPGV